MPLPGLSSAVVVPTVPVTACTAGQVYVMARGTSEGSTFTGIVTFTADEGVTCTLSGTPQVTLLTMRGKEAATTAKGNGAKITLGRTETAVAGISWRVSVAGRAGCPTVTGLITTPPGIGDVLHASLVVAQAVHLCSTPAVTAVAPEATGTGD